MLKSFEVKDYALIEHISVEFGSGLNIITGETGAGKSILIDAMSLLLGERASTEVVRKGAEKSFVEGIFNVKGNKKVKSLLEENDIDFNDELIIRREISLRGSNRCFINDTPVNLNLVKDIGNLLVDLHVSTNTNHYFTQKLTLITSMNLATIRSFFNNTKKFILNYLRKRMSLRSCRKKRAA